MSANQTIKLQTGSDAVILYGRRLVPCIVTAVRPSLPKERFVHHKTVRLTAPTDDLDIGACLTSEAGHVFPAAAVLPNGGIAEYEVIPD